MDQTVEVTVAAESAARFQFLVQPQDVRKDEPFSVQVALVDAAGNVAPLSGVVIYIGLFRQGKDRPNNKRLDGERYQATVNGIAVFSDLRVKLADEGFRLRARSDALPTLDFVFSEPFDVD